MTDLVDTLYAQCAATLRKSAGDAENPAVVPAATGPRPAPPLVQPSKDQKAVVVTPKPAGDEIKPVVQQADVQQAAQNVTAGAEGAVQNVASGKDSVLFPLADTANLETLIAKGQFAGTPLHKSLPTVGVDKLTPAELGAAMRAYRSVNATPTLKQVMSGRRLFTNPANAEDAKANIDLEAVRGMYEGRVSNFTPEELAAYRASLYPGKTGIGEELATEHGVPLVAEGAPARIKAETEKAAAERDAALKAVETDPDGTGFTDWFTESWGNIAVPAGMLLMLFGGDTGALLGGLAVAAGGYDIYNRYNTLTNDPAAQMAISQFIKGGMNKKSLEDIRANFGDRYAKASLDFMALSRYGFLSTVQNKYRDAGMRAYRAQLPGTAEKDVEAFGKTLPGATPDQNAWGSDWTGKGMKGIGNVWNQGVDWIKGTPAATPAATK